MPRARRHPHRHPRRRHPRRREPLAVAASLALAALAPSPAGAINIAELERLTLQRRLDEAWAYSIDARLRRGGLNTEHAEGVPMIMAITMLAETSPLYGGAHFAFSALQFPEALPAGLGWGFSLGVSQYRLTTSSAPMMGDEAAAARQVFAGVNIGLPVAFLEVGWRARADTVDAGVLARLPDDRAAPYGGAAAESKDQGAFVRVRLGAHGFALRAFLEPGEAFLDPALAYLEPEHQAALPGDRALTSQLSARRVSLPGAAPRARLAITETLHLSSWQSTDGADTWTDRLLVRLSVENYYAPDAQALDEALGTFDNYVVRLETEPYYVGTWYSPRHGFGWGLGVAGTSFWEGEMGQTMRVVLRYVRNHIVPEPSLAPVTPWLFEFSAVAGF
jgi:hypothetical protein